MMSTERLALFWPSQYSLLATWHRHGDLPQIFKFLFNLNVKQSMRIDYAYFEYKAKITNAGHAENEGELVHCMIRMKRTDEQGRRRRNVDLEQQAGDNILFVLNPGPHRKISHSSIWEVSEELFRNAGPPSAHHQVGDCEILCY